MGVGTSFIFLHRTDAQPIINCSPLLNDEQEKVYKRVWKLCGSGYSVPNKLESLSALRVCAFSSVNMSPINRSIGSTRFDFVHF